MPRQVDGHDLSTPFVDAMLPDGSRLHVVIPQITREHMAVNMRLFVNLVVAKAAGTSAWPDL